MRYGEIATRKNGERQREKAKAGTLRLVEIFVIL